jgi:hypothetical protein
VTTNIGRLPRFLRRQPQPASSTAFARGIERAGTPCLHAGRTDRLALPFLLILWCLAISSCSGTSPPSGSRKEPVATVAQAVQAPPKSTPWLIVLCTASDYTTLPAGQDVNFFRNLFARQGTGGLFNYWYDQSYGNVDLSGSVVTDWAPGPDPSYIAPSDGNRWIAAPPPNAPGSITGPQVVQDCINTQQGKQDFSKFYNFIAFYNVLVGTSAAPGTVIGGKTYEAVKADYAALGMASLAHEMGHGYGLDHSFADVITPCADNDGRPGAYCDPYDIMSFGATDSYSPGSLCLSPGVEGCLTGPGLNIWNRWQLGWIQPTPVAGIAKYRLYETPSWPATYTQTFTVAPRNHPELATVPNGSASGVWLGLVVPAHQDAWYTVEFVTSDGWEQGTHQVNGLFPSAPVLLVHRVYPAGPQIPYLLVDVGGTQTDTSHPFDDGAVRIALTGMQGSPLTATVQVSYSPGFATAQQNWLNAGFNGGCGGNFVADVTGDHKADIVGLGCGYVGVEPSTGTSFGPYQTWLSSSFNGQYGNFVADVTGDGKADLVGLGNGYVGVEPSTGTSFGPYQTWLSGTFNGQYGNFVADVTGEGRADLVGLGNGYIGVEPSTGTSFGPYQTWYGATFTGVYGTLIGDVTGDKKADLVALNQNSVVVLPSTGSSFGPPQTWLNQAFAIVPGKHVPTPFLADVNGDGIADLVGVGDGYIGVLTSAGSLEIRTVKSIGGGYETWSQMTFNGDFAACSSSWPAGPGAPGCPAAVAADVTGDRLADLIAFHSSSVQVLPIVKAP